MVCCAVDSTKNWRNELTNKNVWFMRCTCRLRPGFGSLNLIMNVCWSEEEKKGMTWNRWHDNLMHLLTKDCSNICRIWKFPHFNDRRIFTYLQYLFIIHTSNYSTYSDYKYKDILGIFQSINFLWSSHGRDFSYKKA